ncbi:dapper homolog 3-like [Pithys albifrons albifrons]|uniref:dapper homolog 3-like n=1 Tax=Pithys albifrons albifrons TaxID=3385563 RepID=UPI003A5D0F73
MVPGSPGTAAQGEAGRSGGGGGPAERGRRALQPAPAGRRRARASARPPANGGAPPRPAPPRAPHPRRRRGSCGAGIPAQGRITAAVRAPPAAAPHLPPPPPQAQIPARRTSRATGPALPPASLVPPTDQSCTVRCAPSSSGEGGGVGVRWVRRNGTSVAAEVLLCGSSRSRSASLFSQTRLFLFVILPRQKTKQSFGGDAGGGVGPGSGRGRGLDATVRGLPGKTGLLRPARSVPAALRTVSWGARERAAPLPPCALHRVTGGRRRASRFPALRSPLSPAPLPIGRCFPCAASGATRGRRARPRKLQPGPLRPRTRRSK